MLDVDERLRRELREIAEPGDPWGVAERVEVRGRRLHVRRRVEAGALAAGVLAVFGLSVVFVWHGFVARPSGHGRPAQGGPGTAMTSPVLFTAPDPADTSHLALFELNPSNGAFQVIPGTDATSPQAPAWSPDGLHVAYYSGSAPGGVGDEPGIHVMDPDGSNAHRVTTFGIEPSWSPDGTRIAFFSSPEGSANDHVYVVNADGTDVHQIGAGAWPSWSPDGARIALATDQDRLEVMNVDGSNVRDLGVDGIRPDWSPDGTMIAFSRDDGIYTVHPDGTGMRALATGPGAYEDPSWSPDGAMIAFSLDADQSLANCPGESTGCHISVSELWEMNADGTGLRQMTHLATVQHPNGGTAPAWAPVSLPLP